jgi:NADH-quinone oxidoreductase subunit A
LVWLQVAIYAASVVGLGATFLVISHLLAPRRFRVEKLEPYECGVPLLADSRDRFSVRFYLVAIMFILFDVETVFMIPWAVLYRQLGLPGLVEVGIFFGVLGLGLVYLWQRGGLEWD